jgi:alkylation response protein AidB-like acyl-CoA dehydrogenase
MKFILDSDQESLRDGIAGLCAGRFAMSRVRQGFDRDAWKELAEAGVFTLPELGFGLAEEAIVFEELGRALVPGPLVWGVLAHSDNQVATGVEGNVVTHFDAADTVYAADAGGVSIVEPVDVEAVARPLDPLTPAHKVTSTRVLSRTDHDPAVWSRNGVVLTAAYLVGMAAACTDAAVAYAKERQQFDTPIGRFQSIKHLLADCLVRAELARAAVHAAAVDPSDRAASSAKILAGDAALQNARTSFQVHGGMGFTWEIDVHLYLKRAWILDRQFGTADAHAAALGAGNAAADAGGPA